jgi:hypothetical protein
MFRTMRQSNMDAWSKAMIQLVNTEAYAKATGMMLDTWLGSSAPFRKALEAAMTQVLANLEMPSRAEVIQLAERLTNIEMKLDDLDAKLDEIQRAGSKSGRPKAQSNHAEKPR